MLQSSHLKLQSCHLGALKYSLGALGGQFEAFHLGTVGGPYWVVEYCLELWEVSEPYGGHYGPHGDY